MNRSQGNQIRWWMIPLAIVIGAILLPIVLLLVVIALLRVFITSLVVHSAAWLFWRRRGHDVLFVYSNSPIWKEYIETEILPAIRDRSVVLNWSERKKWPPGIPRMMFDHFGGSRGFNPMAVAFRPYQRTRVFRFWYPFRDWKHGKPEALHRVEKDFFDFVGIDRGRNAA